MRKRAAAAKLAHEACDAICKKQKRLLHLAGLRMKAARVVFEKAEQSYAASCERTRAKAQRAIDECTDRDSDAMAEAEGAFPEIRKPDPWADLRIRD